MPSQLQLQSKLDDLMHAPTIPLSKQLSSHPPWAVSEWLLGWTLGGGLKKEEKRGAAQTASRPKARFADLDDDLSGIQCPASRPYVAMALGSKAVPPLPGVPPAHLSCPERR